MNTASLPIPLAPTPDQEARLFEALSDPDLTFRAIAALANASTEALALWMARPEISARLESTDSFTTWRTRLIAKASLSKVVSTCCALIDDFNSARNQAAHASTPAPEISSPASAAASDPLRPVIIKLRAAESVRRACSLLARLSNLAATPAPCPRATNLPALGHVSALDSRARETTAARVAPAQPRATDLPAPGHIGALDSRPHSTPRHPSARPSKPSSQSPLPAPSLSPISTLLDPPSRLPRKANSPQSLLAAAGKEHWP